MNYEAWHHYQPATACGLEDQTAEYVLYIEMPKRLQTAKQNVNPFAVMTSLEKRPIKALKLKSFKTFCFLFFFSEDVPVVELMYLVCQVRVTVGDSGLCCCAYVTCFER